MKRSTSEQCKRANLIWIVGRASIIAFALGCLLTSTAQAQRFPDDFFNGNGNPFDPSQMMNSFFGDVTEEEAELLADVEISVREEMRFGNESLEQFLEAKQREGFRFVERGPEVDYLRELIDKVRPKLQNARRYRRIRVILAETTGIEAMSFPGGGLVFSRGMLELCPNEAALIGVIGHELSHLDRGHQLLPLKRSKLAQQTFSGARGFDFQSMMQSFAVMSQMWTRPFRPEDESQADADGATWMYELGYDPRELAQLFLRLAERRPNGANQMPGFLRAHPFDRDRYDAIMTLYEELQQNEPNDELVVGAEAHQEKLRGFARGR